MADRTVTHSRKDADGDIIALCNPGQSWSPRGILAVIQDIENGTHTYRVFGNTRILVVNGPTRKYLRSAADATSGNNLDDLDDC
ncbi:MAG: DUF3892 domain-containing protein [Candidatus Promineifilaceae bacterium]|jgi:hypothetical protein